MSKQNKTKTLPKKLAFILGGITLILILGGLFISNKMDTTNSNNKNNTESSIDSKQNPIVVFETSKGKIELELFLKESPITAGNFKKLVKEGFYDGTKFHRVIKDFMIQGGDPQSKDDSLQNKWGGGGPGYSIKDEFIDGLSNLRGTIAMANSGPNSGGSQFFINVKDNTFLDWNNEQTPSKHPVFGKIVSGMEVVDSIDSVKTTDSDRPVENVVIIKAYLK